MAQCNKDGIGNNSDKSIGTNNNAACSKSVQWAFKVTKKSKWTIFVF